MDANSSSTATPINQVTSTGSANANNSANANANSSNNANNSNNVNNNKNSNNKTHLMTNVSSTINNAISAGMSAVVFENGTIMGAVYENGTSYNSNNNNSGNNQTSGSSSSNNSHNNINLNILSHSQRHGASYYQQPEGQFASIPEIVINGGYSSHPNLQAYHHPQLLHLRQPYHHPPQYHPPQPHPPPPPPPPPPASQAAETTSNCDESAVESSTLLVSTTAENTRTTTTTTKAALDVADGVGVVENGLNSSEGGVGSDADGSGSADGDGDVALDISTDAGANEEFEQFMMNRSTSDSNILDSSFYSELQFQQAIGLTAYGGGVPGVGVGGVTEIGGIAGGTYIGTTAAQHYHLAAVAAAQRAQLGLPPLPPPPAAPAQVVAPAPARAADMLNTSNCSQDTVSRTSSNNTSNNNTSNNNNNNQNSNNNNNTNTQRNTTTTTTKRTRTRRTRKSPSSKAKWNNANVAAAAAATAADMARGTVATAYPPQYHTIFLDQDGNVATTAAANAMGHVAGAAAAGPFIGAPIVDAATAAAAYLQQQPYQLITTATAPYAHLGRHHMHHRRFLDTANAVVNNPDGPGVCGGVGGAVGVGAGTCTGVPGAVGAVGASSPNDPISMMARTRNGQVGGVVRSTFTKCFSRPIVPFIIGIFALGGAACTLGGVVLGATGLVEHTTQYLSASLLMIGIGLSMLIVSGIIWRLCSPNDADECPCYRLMENCRNCNSPFCNNRLLSSGYLYPEFQHRPPPPSYLTSLHECAAIGLINGAVYSGLRMNTPPPLYRSTNSLSVFIPGSNSNTPTLTTNTPTTTFTPTTVMPNNNNSNSNNISNNINNINNLNNINNNNNINNLSNNRVPPQTGPPNYLPPVALPNAAMAATATATATPTTTARTATIAPTIDIAELLLTEQTVLIENLQTEIEHVVQQQQKLKQQEQVEKQQQQQQQQQKEAIEKPEQKQQKQKQSSKERKELVEQKT